MKYLHLLPYFVGGMILGNITSRIHTRLIARADYAARLRGCRDRIREQLARQYVRRIYTEAKR